MGLGLGKDTGYVCCLSFRPRMPKAELYGTLDYEHHRGYRSCTYETTIIMIAFWIVFAILAVVSNATAVTMKVRLNEILPEGERFSWWNRDGRAVSRKYQELFPDSYLPYIDRYSFWIIVALLGAAVMVSVWHSR